MLRHDGRNENNMRQITIETNVLKHAEGSVLISFGETKVLCAATVEERVPPFLRGGGTGWVTAEYSMLPRATNTRNMRESVKGKLSGRTMEIQRLIARSLRSVVDLKALGERSIVIDCDVIQADGGTRTASITGGFVALSLAVEKLINCGELAVSPIKEHIAAVSCGVLSDGTCVLDLDYEEDFMAQVDMNIVMTESGRFAELQGTGEEATFSGEELNTMLLLGKCGIQDLILRQKAALHYMREKADDINKGEKPQIIIATNNLGKAKEFTALFQASGYEVKTLRDFPDIPEVAETGTTFAENAKLKAETIAGILHCPVLADDSGLKVDALGGLPGVYSARFAGEQKSDAANNAKLLHELTDIPKDQRHAAFHCTLAFAAPGKETLVVTGEVAGEIGTIPKGENGFGYDPLFIVPSYQKTMAELTDEEKNQISHRRKAIDQLQKKWQGWMLTSREE